MLDCAKFEFLTISFDNMTLRRKTNWMRNKTKSSKLYAQLGKSNYANSHWTKLAREISTTKKQQSHTFVKVAGDRFRSTVCIYDKITHEVRRLIPKMREIFTNRLRNVSASVIARAKRSLVKYTIFQRIVLSAWSGDNRPWIKITHIQYCRTVTIRTIRTDRQPCLRSVCWSPTNRASYYHKKTQSDASNDPYGSLLTVRILLQSPSLQ